MPVFHGGNGKQRRGTMKTYAWMAGARGSAHYCECDAGGVARPVCGKTVTDLVPMTTQSKCRQCELGEPQIKEYQAAMKAEEI